MPLLTVKVYVQNFKTISRRSNISQIESSFTEILRDVIASLTQHAVALQYVEVGTVQFVPNYATPRDHKELLDPNAWSLWSAIRVELRLKAVLPVSLDDIERELIGRLKTGVHILPITSEVIDA